MDTKKTDSDNKSDLNNYDYIWGSDQDDLVEDEVKSDTKAEEE